MTIELSKEVRTEAVASIERYFRENMEEKIGNIAASGLLNLLLEEVGRASITRQLRFGPRAEKTILNLRNR